MTDLTKENFKKEVEEQSGLIVIDLYADWCAPCQMLAPIIAELEDEMSDVKFCKINIDKEQSIAALFRVDSIPMIAVVKDNTFLDMHIGYADAETLRALISQYK